jgi:hypothetical protein
MYDSVFIITSTIMAEAVVTAVPNKQRYEQTIETIKSIRKYAPNSFIILVENSLFYFYSQELIGAVDSYVNVSNNPDSIQINLNRKKGIGDAYMVVQGLNVLKKYNIKAKRIFKVCGRYWLTDKFNLQEHISAGEKYMFKRQEPSEYTATPVLSTRIWSMSFNKINETISMLLSVVETMNRENIDLEPAMFKTIPEQDYQLTEWLGLSGYLAIWNKYWEE